MTLLITTPVTKHMRRPSSGRDALQKICRRYKVPKSAVSKADFGISVGFVFLMSTVSLVVMLVYGWPAMWAWICGIVTTLAWVFYYIVNPKKKKA